VLCQLCIPDGMLHLGEVQALLLYSGH
jgi:hypothetical protein